MSILFDKADIKVMSPITRKLEALLKADGYSLLEAGRIQTHEAPAGASYKCTAGFVNQLEFISKKGERVFITTHENFKKVKA